MITRQGPFNTESEAECFANGIEYANSFYGGADIPGPEVVNPPVLNNGQWWLDVSWQDPDEEEEDEEEEEE